MVYALGTCVDKRYETKNRGNIILIIKMFKKSKILGLIRLYLVSLYRFCGFVFKGIAYLRSEIWPEYELKK